MRILSLLVVPAFLIFLTQKSQSPHGSDFKINCSTCHSTKGWQLDKKVYSFNHNTTKLPLVGQHAELNCRQCHKSLIFKEAKKNCNECHSDVHQTTVGSDCSRCHTPVSWLVKNINEIHQVSRFPLFGAHKTIDCILCHKSESQTRYDVPGINCVDCHRQDYVATKNPNHIEAGFSEDCSTCHQTNAYQWTGAGFSHSFFPLVQGHSTPKCADCHTSKRYLDTKPECNLCHLKDFNASVNPDHKASKFPTTCGNCHTLIPGWKPATFDHSKFALTLGHSIPRCVDCHPGFNYASTPNDCFSCHQKDYQSTTNPNHITSSFSKSCTDCHTTNPGWRPTTFNHSSFPLTLGHSVPTCNDCHKGNYTSIPTDCYSCHQKDFQSSTNPNHTTASFAKTCLDCHTTNPGWKPTTYKHTIFPLTLGHSVPTCNDCHKGNYTTTPTDCYSCHTTDFQTAANPNHITSGFSKSCQDCHTTNPGWKPTTFNHGSFPLTLGHSVPTCNDCHKGNYTTTPTDCYACHQAVYQSSTNPNHIAANFSRTCLDCHTTNPGWKPTKFNHSNFPLTLGHSVPTCNDCHKGNYTTTPTDCYSCHQTDYQTTTNPNHSTSNFSKSCLDCHTTNPGWKPTTFNHNSFPLTLGHAIPTCNDCHKGNYTTTPTDCYSCHQGDFNKTVNPSHQSLGFSSVCTQCHTTTPGWKPASYLQHDSQSFPIYSGKHRGQWSKCTDCHANPSSYAQFSCITCHEHNKADMDSKHRGRSGYSYDSAACFRCHPRGSSK